jgi:hypothetical protein
MGIQEAKNFKILLSNKSQCQLGFRANQTPQLSFQTTTFITYTQALKNISSKSLSFVSFDGKTISDALGPEENPMELPMRDKAMMYYIWHRLSGNAGMYSRA